MFCTMLRGKIHRAAVTDANLDYEGSLSVDVALLDAAGIHPYEKVDVVNLNTGGRFETYAIPAPVGSGTIGLNGGAARLGQVGDLLIILAYSLVPNAEAASCTPRVVLVDGLNRVKEVRNGVPAPHPPRAHPARPAHPA